MTFFENDTPFFVPFAENLPSPGLEMSEEAAASPTETGTAENAAAAAAALTELEMSEEAETTISRKMNSSDEEGLVFRMPHLLGNTEGGMMSPPWVQSPFEEAWSLMPNFNAGMGMGGGTSPSRMNYPSPPSGNSSPLELWNFEDQELENRKGMTMPPTWKPCREEVDAGSGSALGQNESLGIRAAQNMGLGGTVQTSDYHSVNNVDEWFQLEAGIMMNYSLPSDDSPPLGGSFYRYIFWDYGGVHELPEISWCERLVSLEIDYTVVELGIKAESGLRGVKPCLLSLVCLCQNMVIEIGNGEQIIRLNVKLKHAYLEVFSSEKSNAICSELESWGGMIRERISVNHQRRYAFCSKTRPWSVILELLDVVARRLLYLGKNNYSFGISVNDDRSSVNTKMHSLLYFGRSQSTVLEMQHLNSLERKFVDHFERLVQTGVLELLSGEEIKLRYLQEEEVGTASKKNHSFSFLPTLIKVECRMMQLVGKRRHDIFKVTPSTFKQARRDFGITRRSLQEVGTASEENHTALIWPAQYNAAGSGGILLPQEDSSSEPHIPESSPTNEETNNVVVVELNNSIDDAKGGNSSSHKTHTVSRWEKDYGITCQVPEPLFGKSRNAAAETLKGRGGMLLQQEDSSSEPHIPKSSATNEETNNVVVELNNSIDDAKGGNSSSEKTHTISRWEKDHGITRQVPEPLFGKSRNAAAETLKGRGGMLLQQEDSSSEPHIPEPSATNEVGTASEENHTAHIWPAQYNAAGSGGMLLQQKDSSSEPHIPESSPTNEERNNVVVVELNNTNSIDDAEHGKSSSEKTHTICRWEKDYGITRQALEQLFGESRADAAKTLKVSISTFKRACRDFGINRWPNHKGKRPNCSLNLKQDVQAFKKHKGIQPCPALPPLQATNTGQCNSTMSVKVEKCKEINQRTFEPKKHHDISSAVLGKKDHLGSVRRVGSYSTIQRMFGRPDQKRSTSSRVFTIDVVKEMMDKCRLDTITEMETKMQPKIDSLNQQLQLLMKNMSATQISVGTPRSVYTPFDPPPTRSTCHSVDTYPVTTIKSPKKCTLAVCPGGTPTVVPKGMAHPSTDETVVHHQPSSTIGNFAQPPMHLVILDENLSKENKKTKDQSGDISAIGTRPPIVDDDALSHLGDNCKYLVSLLTSFPLDKDYIDLEIDKSIFHRQNASFIFVMMNDIKDLLTMECLSVSIIQVFILLCNEFQVMSIGFACPTQISKDMLKLNVPFVTNYFIHIMKENKDKQFILAPYHQDFHWLLLVISIRKRNVYVLDPLPYNRDIAEVKASLNLAFRFVPTNGRSKTINWIQCNCPIQPGRVECGYYVMRYMLDIVTKYSHVDRLDEAFESNRPYSMDDINEIRDQWAKFFFSQCV